MNTAKPTAAENAHAALIAAEEARQVSLENNRMLKDLHAAWMTPHAGYGGRSLLDCVSEIVTEASAGKIVGERIVWYAKVIGALSAIAGAIWWGSR